MKIDRKKLLSQLESVSSGLSSKEIVEQSNAFVFRGGRVLTFNDEVAVSTSTDLKIEGAVIADPLWTLLKKLTEDELDVEVSNGELLVKGNRRRSGIRLEAQVMLPVECIEQPEQWHKLHGEFLDAVSIVQNCASDDPSSFLLTCVHVHPKWVEACDRFQICRYPLKTGFTKPTLIRSVALKGIMGGSVVEFAETENWCHFRSAGGLTFSCRRYSEQYPDLEQYLTVQGTKTPLPTGIQDAVDKATIFSSDDLLNFVTVELRAGKMKLTGRGSHGWFSELKEMKYDGDELKFNIAPDLLVEITKKAEEVLISQGRLMVQTEKWVYASCTMVPEEGQ